MFEHRIQRTAWLVAIASLLPLAWLCVRAHTSHGTVIPALLGYGAMLLAFFTGGLWTRALTLRGNAALTQWLLVLYAAPLLAGLLAVQVSGRQGVFFLLLSFPGLLGLEYRHWRMELLPDWYWRLRLRTTCITLALLLIASLA